jgi:hypothetical protein
VRVCVRVCVRVRVHGGGVCHDGKRVGIELGFTIQNPDNTKTHGGLVHKEPCRVLGGGIGG